MADYANVENMLSGLAADGDKSVFRSIFKYLLKDIRFGRATTLSSAAPSKNLGGGFVVFTTPAVANQEFAVPHGFGHPPYLCMPVLPLDTVGAGIVAVTVTRAADNSYVYLKSATTNQVIYLFLEG